MDLPEAGPGGRWMPMLAEEEERLVARLKRRDEAAFNELVRHYEGRIFRLVFRMIGDRAEAEDLAQEVFVTVFKRIDGFRGESRLGTWLYRVATNHCRNRIKYLQRRARGGQRELDETVEGDVLASASMSTSAQVPRPDELAHGYRVQRALEVALAELPEEQRELVLLRDVEGLSYEEIQEVTGLAEGTVKSRLHRARLALQLRIESLREGT